MSDASVSAHIPNAVFNYASEHEYLFSGRKPVWDIDHVYRMMTVPTLYANVPKFFRDAIAHDGEQFASVADMPLDTVYRVCRGNEYLPVGLVVWHGKSPNDDTVDGLNLLQQLAFRKASVCNAWLEGVHFESTDYEVDVFKNTLRELSA